MAATDLVPCYYTGQNYRAENPAKLHTRVEVREFKKQKRGEFKESGTIFLFFERVKKIFEDGLLGVGNLLPFAKAHNYGDKLHYEMPMAGDTGMRRHGLYQRRDEEEVMRVHSREIKVSSRNMFARQVIA